MADDIVDRYVRDFIQKSCATISRDDPDRPYLLAAIQDEVEKFHDYCALVELLTPHEIRGYVACLEATILEILSTKPKP